MAVAKSDRRMLEKVFLHHQRKENVMNFLKTVREGNAGQALAERTIDPFSVFQRDIGRAIDRAFLAFNGGIPSFEAIEVWPALDVVENETALTLRADLPGVDAKDVEVEITGKTLTISGSRKEEHKEEKKGFLQHERRSGSFFRSITLPDYLDPAKIEAKYEKGVLSVTIPKVPGQGPKRVPVKTT